MAAAKKLTIDDKIKIQQARIDKLNLSKEIQVLRDKQRKLSGKK